MRRKRPHGLIVREKEGGTKETSRRAVLGYCDWELGRPRDSLVIHPCEFLEATCLRMIDKWASLEG